MLKCSKPHSTYKAFQLALFWSKLCINSCFNINSIRKQGNRTKIIRSILHIFYEGPAVAFNTQGSEGQWAGPAVTQTRSSLIRVASKERSGEESNGSRIQFCLTSFNPRTLYFEDSSTGPDQQMWRPCSEKFVGLYTHKIKIKCQMLVFCSIFVT